MTRWRIEVCSFSRSTFHGNIEECSGQDAANPISGWIKIVEPGAPEGRKLGVRADDTVEEGEHDEEDGEHVGDHGKGGGKGSDQLTPGGLE